MNHRASGVACPTERAPVSTKNVCSCGSADAAVSDSGLPCQCGSCSQDSDCTNGMNGRCAVLGPIRYYQCTYDQCFADSDCDAGAPCECRALDTSAAANACLTQGNCRTDSDCGPGGFCSPSLVNNLCSCLSVALCGDSGGGCYVGGPGATGLPPGPGWAAVPCECGDACGHGYFCHTPCDGCVDDSDCDGGTCNYDVVSNRWSCSYCVPIP